MLSQSEVLVNKGWVRAPHSSCKDWQGLSSRKLGEN